MWKAISFALLSAILLILSLPNFNLAFLAWIGLVPLLFALKDRNLKSAFGVSLITGFIFYIGVFYWINIIKGFKLIDYIPLLTYFSLYFAIFGLTFNFISKKTSLPSIITVPVLWVSLEYIRAHAIFLKLPCALLGHSQYLQLPIIQISSLTGVYGVSFLIVMVNAAFYEILLYSNRRSLAYKKQDDVSKNRLNLFKSIAVSIIAIVLSLAYGIGVLSSKKSGGDKLKIAVIQANIPQRMKWKREFREQNLNKHLALTQEALKNRGISLVIWPEASVQGPLRKNSAALKTISNLAWNYKTFILIGSSQRPKFGSAEFRVKNRFNNAYLVSPKGTIAGKYSKIGLLPFGEYLPLRDVLPWSSRLIEKVGRYIPGDEHTVFDVEKAGFGVVICWESLFPELVRQFVENGANFMVNITNEAWFGKTAVPYQFMAMTVFRAVENRVALARSANTGISCFIDPYGKITGRVQDQGKDIFVQGYLVEEIPISHKKTFYTRNGDIFAYITLIMCGILLITAIFAAKRE